MVDTYYKAALVDFKSFLNDHAYDQEYKSSQEELGAVNAIENKNVCTFKPYGTATSDPNDHPLQGQAHSYFGRW
jgi:hypothetical protein